MDVQSEYAKRVDCRDLGSVDRGARIGQARDIPIRPMEPIFAGDASAAWILTVVALIPEKCLLTNNR